MIKTKKQMFTVIGAFVLVMMLMTVTYAFFNYTRTGVSNTIKTGRIYFNAEQGDTVTLSDLFPITLEASQEVSSETPGVGSLTIHVTGDTMYDKGIEYLVKAVDVTNTAGNSSLPISVEVKYEAASGKTIGMEDEDYFTNRGGNSSLYKVLSKNSITDDGELVVGYIAKGQTGIDGTITIMAYLDAKNIAISDTYPSGDVTHTESSGETSVEVVDYTNETTSNWVGERTVFTTSEWNALQSTGVSFKIKVEAQEGEWVDEPTPNYPIPSCPGCKFVFPTYGGTAYYYTAANEYDAPVATLETFEENGDTLVDDYTTLNSDSFLGFKFDQNGNVIKAYACGIKGEDPNNGVAFCLEGSTDGSTYSANQTLLNDSQTGLWKGECTVEVDNIYCDGIVSPSTYAEGMVSTGLCGVYASGYADCS